ncbi:cyanidin 3-O-galactoside 2''-O-xylosyltransferase FGGT1-like [Juglans microcarpa x Juglans regia]|uniref:cyanidin 3-O-galactoside 2''-O-xylosyltransferase FGGT1-like n=1 Tax=Juglans microcarpa x Juglans regia TaxID=2249226 RepID=UPI001B7E9164|nr:cyanidin 3-O-galactoside 2''-O-xylosyltransferase FGGT1-like [Juglans microcarpa x Juglans regia]
MSFAANMSSEALLHIAMYPWFAIGHLNSFMDTANKLAERGDIISFFLPAKTQTKLEPLNLYKDLITFIPITVPQVDGLPSGTEITADIPRSLLPLLTTAFDLTEPTIESSLRDIKPHFVFYDFAHWLPSLARRLCIKAICLSVVGPPAVGYLISPERKLIEKPITEVDLRAPPQSFPPSSIKLSAHESREALTLVTVKKDGQGGISFVERLMISYIDCDALVFKACREMEGIYCDYLEAQFRNPVILSGPMVPRPPTSALEKKWATWMDGFEAKTVIFCALGSECILKKDQFQELILGLELSGLPFFAALKPPMGVETIESALPEGFEERVMGRGLVHGEWVQQQLILQHPSVGCFVTHCGSNSSAEGLVSECQLVLLPHAVEQHIIAREMAGDLKLGVEVEKGEEDGLFTREGVCRAVRAVMDDDSKVGQEVRANHTKWRELLLSPGLENSYLDSFVQRLYSLLQ